MPLPSLKQILSSVLLVSLLGLSPTRAIASPTTTLVARNNTIAATVNSLQRSKQRWIEINLSSQRLTAWEGRTPVYTILISTGKADTPTKTGVFAIQSRYRYARMRGADYDVADVPYTMYYYGSYAIHGAYWHRRFGTPVSHGCTNVAVNHARWLFNWSSIGTPVIVRR